MIVLCFHLEGTPYSASEASDHVCEVYLIDESTLKAMDLLEGVHRGRYRRRGSMLSCVSMNFVVGKFRRLDKLRRVLDNTSWNDDLLQQGRTSTCSSRQRRAI